ncbi:hypothetical protein BCD49_23675 [Pseudofrankia sp. EUN1h]|nr:hypothetical protein BCD49_23675 [Pseudofrankia sp. EUN1h]
MALNAVVRRELVVELLRGPMALAAAAAGVNLLNLVMNLVLARVLDADGYGAVVEQTNIFMVLSVVGTAVLIAVVHRDLAARDEETDARRGWARRLRGLVLLATLATALVAFALCGPVATLLSYPHPVAIAEAALAAAVWVSLCVERGLLQARRDYPALAANLFLETFLRVTCIIVLACAGLGVDGVGLGLVLGVAVGAVLARRAVAGTSRPAWLPASGGLAGGETTRAVPSAARARGQGVHRRTRDGLAVDTSTALATLVPLALLQNMDVVIVGWRNPDAVAGYAAISTACKVPVFMGLAVANYLLAEAALRRRDGRPAGQALAMALGVVVTPGLLLAAVGAVAGHQLLALVFGPRLTAAADGLWVLALAMTCLSVTLLFASFLLGARSRQIVWVLAGCAPLTAVVLALADGLVMRTALAGLGCQAFTAAVAGTLILRQRAPRPAGWAARSGGHVAVAEEEGGDERGHEAVEQDAQAGVGVRGRVAVAAVGDVLQELAGQPVAGGPPDAGDDDLHWQHVREADRDRRGWRPEHDRHQRTEYPVPPGVEQVVRDPLAELAHPRRRRPRVRRHSLDRREDERQRDADGRRREHHQRDERRERQALAREQL